MNGHHCWLSFLVPRLLWGFGFLFTEVGLRFLFLVFTSQVLTFHPEFFILVWYTDSRVLQLLLKLLQSLHNEGVSQTSKTTTREKQDWAGDRDVVMLRITVW